MKQLLKISSNGLIQTIESKTDLETLQGHVGGLIEFVNIEATDLAIILNQEGLLIKLPVNRHATTIAWFSGSLPKTNPIVGDVLIVKNVETPESTVVGGITQDDIDYINILINRDNKLTKRNYLVTDHNNGTTSTVTGTPSEVADAIEQYAKTGIEDPKFSK